MNPWDVLENNDFGISSGNDILLGTSGSMYRVILAAAVTGLACTLVYSFIRIALIKNSRAREEEKKEITGKKIKPFLNILKNTATFTIPFYVMKINACAGSYDFLGDTGIKDGNIDMLGNALKKEGAGLYGVWQVLGIAGVMCALALAGLARDGVRKGVMAKNERKV